MYQEKFVVGRNNKIAPDAISDVNKYNLVYIIIVVVKKNYRLYIM